MAVDDRASEIWRRGRPYPAWKYRLYLPIERTCWRSLRWLWRERAVMTCAVWLLSVLTILLVMSWSAGR